eukprot:XP_008650226.1 MAP7 domain-containing protein 1-like [Zea mays]
MPPQGILPLCDNPGLRSAVLARLPTLDESGVAVRQTSGQDPIGGSIFPVYQSEAPSLLMWPPESPPAGPSSSGPSSSDKGKGPACSSSTPDVAGRSEGDGQRGVSPPPPPPSGSTPPPPPPTSDRSPSSRGQRQQQQGRQQQQQRQRAPRFQGHWKVHGPKAPSSASVDAHPPSAVVPTSGPGSQQHASAGDEYGDPSAATAASSASVPSPALAVAEEVPAAFASTVQGDAGAEVAPSDPQDPPEREDFKEDIRKVSDREEEVTQKEKSLARKEVHLNQREEVVTALHDKLKAFNTVLEKQRDKQAAAEVKLQKLQQELTDKARDIARAEESLKAREASLVKRATDLAWQEEDLAFREEMWARRNKLLDELELEAEERRERLEGKVRALEERVRQFQAAQAAQAMQTGLGPQAVEVMRKTLDDLRAEQRAGA